MAPKRRLVSLEENAESKIQPIRSSAKRGKTQTANVSLQSKESKDEGGKGDKSISSPEHMSAKERSEVPNQQIPSSDVAAKKTHHDETASKRRERIRKLFDMVDENRNGRITADDMQRISQKLELGLSLEQINNMISMFDKDSDGKLSLNDFIEAADFSGL